MLLALLVAAALAMLADSPPRPEGKAWPRHTIDDTSQGADGVKLIDVNTDGRPDVVTAWEEGGVVRVYFNPSRVDSRRPWPQVTVGKIAAPEDAVFADLDGDLSFDVVSACEGDNRTMFIHWAPKDSDRYFDASAWTTTAIPASQGKMQWMFATPLQVDGRHGLDIVAGGKNQGAAIGWFEAPANPREVSGWKWHPLRPVGWVMSIISTDMDGDGDQDILFSDRKGARTGVHWLENPGTAKAAAGEPWVEHEVGSTGREVMFLDLADADNDGLRDVVVAVKPRDIHIHKRLDRTGRKWQSRVLSLNESTGTAKSVRVGDIDLDGEPDIVYSAEDAGNGKSGVVWFSLKDQKIHELSGPEGIKYDLVELIDLDGDGDPDVLTTEERTGLGVVWYENPFGR